MVIRTQHNWVFTVTHPSVDSSISKPSCASFTSVACLQTEAEQRARAAAMAGMQKLPEGIRPVPAPAWPEGECQVCSLSLFVPLVAV